MGLQLNNSETETLVTAINYVINTNAKEHIQDVYELIETLQDGAKTAQHNKGKAQNVSYRTIINVLHNFITNMQYVECESALLDNSDTYIMMKETTQIDEYEYLPYLDKAIILKDRLLKELQL